jgi:hypothetical protein
MNFTQHTLADLFKKATNFKPVKIRKISQGSSINVNLGYGSIRVQALQDLESGDAITFQTDQGNWYLIGTETEQTRGTSQRQIISRVVRPNTNIVRGSVLFLYKLEGEYKVNNNNQRVANLVNADSFFDNGYIENLGKNKFIAALDYSFGRYMIGFRNKAYLGDIDPKLDSYYYPDIGFENGYLFNYKGNLKWESQFSELDKLLDVSFPDEEKLYSLNITDVPPYILDANIPLNYTLIESEPLLQNYAGSGTLTVNSFYHLVGFNEEPIHNEGTELQNISIDETYLSFELIEVDNISTFSFALEKELGESVTNIVFHKTSRYTYSSDLTFSRVDEILSWNNYSIFIEEIDSNINLSVSKIDLPTEEFENFFILLSTYIINRNYNIYLKNNNSNLELDTSDSLVIQSIAELVITQETSSIEFTGKYTGFMDTTISNVIKNLDGEEIFVAQKIEETPNIFSYWLVKGIINGFTYEDVIQEGQEVSFVIDVSSINKLKYISFASINGTLITNNGSFFTYLLLPGYVSKQNNFDFVESRASIAFQTQEDFNFSSFLIAGFNYYQVINAYFFGNSNIFNQPINSLLKSDNIVKNKIYRTKIIDNITYVEIWNISSEGKIIYNKLIEEKIKVPEGANILAASYYP